MSISYFYPCELNKVIRVSSPKELLGVVPTLIGFTPEKSIVVIGTAPPRNRVVVSLRYDLPPDLDTAAEMAAHAAAVLNRQGKHSGPPAGRLVDVEFVLVEVTFSPR
jgi:hypothetical protein